MTLAEEMVYYRAKEDISQRELARRCGISSQTVNSIESGQQNPTKLTEAKIRIVIGGGE